MGTPTTFSIYKTHIFGGFEALKRPSPFHDFFGCPKANTLEVNCSNLFSSLRAMKGAEKNIMYFDVVLFRSVRAEENRWS